MSLKEICDQLGIEDLEFKNIIVPWWHTCLKCHRPFESQQDRDLHQWFCNK